MELKENTFSPKSSTHLPTSDAVGCGGRVVALQATHPGFKIKSIKKFCFDFPGGWELIAVLMIWRFKQNNVLVYCCLTHPIRFQII